MRFVAVRDMRNRSAQLWSDLSREREMIVTSNGKPVALLTAVTEESVEDLLAAVRQARAVTSVSRMQERSARAGNDRLTRADINAEIRVVRKARRS